MARQDKKGAIREMIAVVDDITSPTPASSTKLGSFCGLHENFVAIAGSNHADKVKMGLKRHFRGPHLLDFSDEWNKLSGLKRPDLLGSRRFVHVF